MLEAYIITGMVGGWLTYTYATKNWEWLGMDNREHAEKVMPVVSLGVMALWPIALYIAIAVHAYIKTRVF